jgi:hypothetical protein
MLFKCESSVLIGDYFVHVFRAFVAAGRASITKQLHNHQEQAILSKGGWQTL